MTSPTRWFIRLAATVLVSTRLFAAAAPELAFPSNEDLRHTRALDTVRLSPDARQVLFRLKESTADGAKSHLCSST